MSIALHSWSYHPDEVACEISGDANYEIQMECCSEMWDEIVNVLIDRTLIFFPCPANCWRVALVADVDNNEQEDLDLLADYSENTFLEDESSEAYLH